MGENYWLIIGRKLIRSQNGLYRARQPRENGHIESFNGKLRDELLNREIFYTLQEAKMLIEQWKIEYNQVRPHSALGYKPPAPRAVIMPPLTATLLSDLPKTLT